MPFCLLYRLGERLVSEYLREIITGADPVVRLARYVVLPADFIAAFGGDQLPGPRTVTGGRGDAA
jgi:hypothetical protein